MLRRSRAARESAVAISHCLRERRAALILVRVVDGIAVVSALPARPGEFSLIEWIRAHAREGAAVRVGIGDDAALVQGAAGDGLLVTSDMLMDGVDFVVGATPAELIGRKCLAVNLSDVAAMAGRPLAAVVSLALPQQQGRALAEGLYHGMLPLAEEFDVCIAGGDTNTWDGPLVVSVTVIGEATGGGPILRSGARPGDWLFVTGALGGSIAGRHLSFQPRLQEAAKLRSRATLHAMIDLSDGLASDVRHIATESGVGVIIDANDVPVHADVDTSLPHDNRLQRALCDGEDFELLFAVSADDGKRLQSAIDPDPPVYRLGEVIAGGECLLREEDGTMRPLPEGGWEHAME